VTADETPPIDFAVIPGRYDGPDLIVNPSCNYEVTIAAAGGTDDFYNAFDLLEVALAAAWVVDREETTKVLSQTRLRGFEVPPHLTGGAP
jgi:hypothetical protein